MISKINGDLLSVKSGHIIHGCNCQGVMGSGVAKLIKDKWPDVYDEYRTVYFEGGLKLGQCVAVQVTDDLVIWNLMTQEYYRGHPKTHPSEIKFVSYDAIDNSLFRMKQDILSYFPNIEPTINFPMIGAGLGGGNWDIIETIIDRTIGEEFAKVLWIYG